MTTSMNTPSPTTEPLFSLSSYINNPSLRYVHSEVPGTLTDSRDIGLVTFGVTSTFNSLPTRSCQKSIFQQYTLDPVPLHKGLHSASKLQLEPCAPINEYSIKSLMHNSRGDFMLRKV